jgi:hypothetical protein
MPKKSSSAKQKAQQEKIKKASKLATKLMKEDSSLTRPQAVAKAYRELYG